MKAANAPVFHLVAASAFAASFDGEQYAPSSLGEQGFVHCADRGHVLAVADDYYRALAEPLLAMEIDPDRLGVELRWEAPAPRPGVGRDHLDGVSEFPHVYGPVRREAVVAIAVLVEAAGRYHWPPTTVSLATWLTTGLET